MFGVSNPAGKVTVEDIVTLVCTIRNVVLCPKDRVSSQLTNRRFMRLPAGGLGAVLVERGWVPSPDAKTLDHEAYLEADSTRVAGVLIRVPTAEVRAREAWPRYVRFPSPEALAESYPYRLATYVIRRTELPSGAPNDLRALPPPELNNGPHLSYAVQWFSFALVALVGAVIFLWHGDSKTQRREGPPTP